VKLKVKVGHKCTTYSVSLKRLRYSSIQLKNTWNGGFLVVWWYDNPENLVHHTTVIPRVPHPGCGMCGMVVVWWYAPRTREMTRTKQLNLLRYWSSTDPTDSPKLRSILLYLDNEVMIMEGLVSTSTQLHSFPFLLTNRSKREDVVTADCDGRYVRF
jgi:hypothetical protein